jgi:hypothetical protein
MRTITLEEHYATEAFMEGPGQQLKAQAEAARSHPQVVRRATKSSSNSCAISATAGSRPWTPQASMYRCCR